MLRQCHVESVWQQECGTHLYGTAELIVLSARNPRKANRICLSEMFCGTSTGSVKREPTKSFCNTLLEDVPAQFFTIYSIYIF